jgi:hypothetical protein
MMKFSMTHFELLKKEVVHAAGITNITPADCKTLSDTIFKKKQQRISETTLKRIYGFAFSQFKPSLFTIDLLSKYCGYRGWNDFCLKQDNKGRLPLEQVNWANLQQSASKITQFTLRTLKNRSGIPYTKTIKRGLINNHLNNFSNSEKPGTILSAPAGYGKSIALCHWLDERLNQDTGDIQKDIFLVFSSNALMSVLLTGRDINDWILALLGYSTDKDISILFDLKQRKDGKFYLIIDGFDEHMLKNDQFRITLDNLVNLLSFHESNDWFKLILTVRTATWINNRHEFNNGDDKWFTGFHHDDSCINVPLFSIAEIKELCLKINPAIQNFIALDIAESFNHPLFFQFYYKQHKKDFSFNNVNHISLYELLSLYILNKIYLGQNSSEKILLLKGLIDAMDIENKVYSINKLKVNDLLKEHANAYHELLSIGYLHEINESNNYSYDTRISFGNENFLGHSFAQNILNKNGFYFDEHLITHINKVFAGSAYKLPVIKWCIIHAIKTAQQNSFGQLTGIVLTFNEKCELINFMGDLLQKEFASSKRNEALVYYFKQSFSEDMFDYFFGLELINIDYIRTLTTLLKFELSTRKRILVYTALAIIAAFNLNLRELFTLTIKLNSFPMAEYQCFAVNPRICLDAIYNMMKYGVVKKEAIAELTKICFNPPEDIYNLKQSASNDILYLLGSFTLLTCNNPKKSVRFIISVSRTYKPQKTSDTSTSYGFFTKIILSDAYFKLGDAQKVESLYYEISNCYKKSEGLLTPFMRTVFHCLKVKMLLISGRYDEIAMEMKCVNAIANEAGSQFSKFYLLLLLLQNEVFLNKYSGVKKQYRYDYEKLIRENNLYNTGSEYADDPIETAG